MRKCPKCDGTLTDEWIVQQAAIVQGSKTSKQKAKASKANGKLGGRPKKKRSKDNG
jgi:hypothetical protein